MPITRIADRNTSSGVGTVAWLLSPCLVAELALVVELAGAARPTDDDAAAVTGCSTGDAVALVLLAWAPGMEPPEAAAESLLLLLSGDAGGTAAADGARTVDG